MMLRAIWLVLSSSSLAQHLKGQRLVHLHSKPCSCWETRFHLQSLYSLWFCLLSFDCFCQMIFILWMNEQISTHHDEHSFWIPSSKQFPIQDKWELSRSASRGAAASGSRGRQYVRDKSIPSEQYRSIALVQNADRGRLRRNIRGDCTFEHDRLNIRKRKELTSWRTKFQEKSLLFAVLC